MCCCVEAVDAFLNDVGVVWELVGCRRAPFCVAHTWSCVWSGVVGHHFFIVLVDWCVKGRGRERAGQRGASERAKKEKRKKRLTSELGSHRHIHCFFPFLPLSGYVFVYTTFRSRSTPLYTAHNPHRPCCPCCPCCCPREDDEAEGTGTSRTPRWLTAFRCMVWYGIKRGIN